MNIVTALFLLAILIALVIGFYYNKFVRNKNKTHEAWSSIEVQLKRRYNLIPNLLNTIKAVAEHEESIFETIAQHRQESINADGVEEQAQAESKLNSSINQLMGLAQQYPELKANKNFLDFQDALEELEKHIQLARRYYNAVVRDTNTAIESFPGVFLAKSFGFKPFKYFEIEDYYTESQNPEVKF